MSFTAIQREPKPGNSRSCLCCATITVSTLWCGTDAATAPFPDVTHAPCRQRKPPDVRHVVAQDPQPLTNMYGHSSSLNHCLDGEFAAAAFVLSAGLGSRDTQGIQCTNCVALEKPSSDPSFEAPESDPRVATFVCVCVCACASLVRDQPTVLAASLKDTAMQQKAKNGTGRMSVET